MRTICALALCGASLAMSTLASAQEIDWKRVDEALGRTAAVGGDVHRYGFPRSDLQVTLDGVAIKPALALGGWVAFKPVHGEVMVMGDLVLLDTEINPVMAKLLAERHRHHRGSQSPAACESADLLHACRRARRSGEAGDSDPCRLGRKQDAAWASGRGVRPAAGDRSRHRGARRDHGRQGPGQRRCLSVRRAPPRPDHRDGDGARSARPDRHGQRRSTSSRPAAARRRSPATSW